MAKTPEPDASAPQPPPRQSLSSVALICRTEGGETRWMARWNKNWQCYFFVGGHKHDEEDFLGCLVREINEELHIENGKDYVILPQPIARLSYTAYSRSAKAQTSYTMEVYGVAAPTQYTVALYDVRLNQHPDASAIRSVQEIRWLSEAEIRAGRTTDGKAVSETMARLLDSVGWTCPARQAP